MQGCGTLLPEGMYLMAAQWHRGPGAHEPKAVWPTGFDPMQCTGTTNGILASWRPHKADDRRGTVPRVRCVASARGQGPKFWFPGLPDGSDEGSSMCLMWWGQRLVLTGEYSVWETICTTLP